MAIPSETFFSIDVRDMQRATAFYVAALGAEVAFASADWTSLRIAGVRVALSLPGPRPRLAAQGRASLTAAPAGGRVGLHFAVGDLPAACADVERAGGRAAEPAIEVAPGVFIASMSDSEGNTFTLSRR